MKALAEGKRKRFAKQKVKLTQVIESWTSGSPLVASNSHVAQKSTLHFILTCQIVVFQVE